MLSPRERHYALGVAIDGHQSYLRENVLIQPALIRLL